MTVESFEREFPADQSFVGNVGSRPEARAGGSPVGLLANIYRNEGVDGLSTIKLNELTTLDSQVSFMKNYSAVHFGNTLLAIEDIMRTQAFDAPFYLDSILGDLRRAGKSSDLVLPGAKVEEVPEEEVNRIMMFAGRDKTFSTFFNGGLQVLPESLRRFLINSEVLYSIRTLVLPEYTDRINLLIAHKEALRAQQAQPTR